MPSIADQLVILQKLAEDVLETVEEIREQLGISDEEEEEEPEPAPTPVQEKPVSTGNGQPAGGTAIPDKFPGADSEELRAVIEHVAEDAGMHPATLEAIERWETGNYTSKLFVEANNPGGMKYRPELPLGHNYGYYSARDGNTYAKFPDWARGVIAHGIFFKQKRYDGIRQTEDPMAEVDAIHNAGYAEHSEEWRGGVKAIVAKILDRKPRDMLSAHFSVEECERSKRAADLAIVNRLPAGLRDNAARVAQTILEPVREIYGAFSPNSWYRSPQLNELTPGASPTSAHTKALAVDLPRNERMWQALRTAPGIAPILLQVEGDHYHVAPADSFTLKYINGASPESWEALPGRET